MEVIKTASGKVLCTVFSLVLALFGLMLTPSTAMAEAIVDYSAGSIQVFLGGQYELTGDIVCKRCDVFDHSSLTVPKGVTMTWDISSDYGAALFGSSAINVRGTMTGSSVPSNDTWFGRSFVNVYLCDGAKYDVPGFVPLDETSGLRYYGYDAATDGNGTVKVTDGSGTAVTSEYMGSSSTSYTFTATPSEGYKFKNWTKGKGGDDISTEPVVSVTCADNGHYQMYANFEKDLQPIDVEVVDGTADVVSAVAGTTVTVTANAAPAGKIFSKWVSDDVEFADATSATTTFVMPDVSYDFVRMYATYADAPTPPSFVRDYSVTYGQTKTIRLEIPYDSKSKIDVKVLGYALSKKGKTAATSPNVKVVKVGTPVVESNKVVIALTVKGINANYGKKTASSNNWTTVSLKLSVSNGTDAGTGYMDVAKVTCKRAAPKLFLSKSKVKKADLKKGAVALYVKSAGGASVKLAAKNSKYFKAAKGSSKLIMKKHACGKQTKKHTTSVSLKVDASKNYSGFSGKKVFAVKMM